MTFGRIKLRPDDILFSKYLRKQRGHQCEVCRRIYPEGKGLQVSHFYSRRNECVRFSEINCDVVCVGCHRKFHESPAEYTEWKKKKLGEKKFNKLRFDAHQTCKKDVKGNVLVIKELIKKLST